jgi:hypothetical protein
VRRGWIATHPKIDFEKKKVFLVDANVFQGSSGSPVFARIDDKVKLLGIVSESYVSRQPQLITDFPGTAQIEFSENVGLAVVIKSCVLPEIFEAVKKERSRRLQLEGSDQSA